MNILATKAVIEGKQINVLHKQDDIWIVLSNDDIKNQESLKDNLYFLEEEELFSRIPRLREHLNHKNETTINIDYETGEFSVNPKHFHIGIPTHGAKATRQANTSFSFIRWIKNNFNEYKTKFFIVGILLILSIYIGWFFYIFHYHMGFYLDSSF